MWKRSSRLPEDSLPHLMTIYKYIYFIFFFRCIRSMRDRETFASTEPREIFSNLLFFGITGIFWSFSCSKLILLIIWKSKEKQYETFNVHTEYTGKRIYRTYTVHCSLKHHLMCVWIFTANLNYSLVIQSRAYSSFLFAC